MSESQVQEPTVQTFPPELQLLVAGLPDDQRDAMVEAFYSVCTGDPKSPPVQFGTFTRGHLRAIVAHTIYMNRATDRNATLIKEIVDLPKLQRMLGDHEKKVASKVELMVSTNRELYESDKKARILEFKMWEASIANLDHAMTTVTKAADAVEKTACHLMWAMAALMVAGMLVCLALFSTGHLR